MREGGGVGRRVSMFHEGTVVAERGGARNGQSSPTSPRTIRDAGPAAAPGPVVEPLRSGVSEFARGGSVEAQQRPMLFDAKSIFAGGGRYS